MSVGVGSSESRSGARWLLSTAGHNHQLHPPPKKKKRGCSFTQDEFQQDGLLGTKELSQHLWRTRFSLVTLLPRAGSSLDTEDREPQNGASRK